MAVHVWAKTQDDKNCNSSTQFSSGAALHCAPRPHTLAQLKGEPCDLGKSWPLFFLDLTNACGLNSHLRRGFKSEPYAWPRRVLAHPQGSLPCWVLLIIEGVERETLPERRTMSCKHGTETNKFNSLLASRFSDVIRLAIGIDSVRAILVPQPGLCSCQSPALEAARAPALRSDVLGAVWLPYPQRGLAGHTEARAFRMAPRHDHASGSGDGCIRSGISRCCQTPIPARVGYNPSTMSCCVTWHGRDFRALKKISPVGHVPHAYVRRQRFGGGEWHIMPATVGGKRRTLRVVT